jgi:hypothetical protein
VPRPFKGWAGTWRSRSLVLGRPSSVPPGRAVPGFPSCPATAPRRVPGDRAPRAAAARPDGGDEPPAARNAPLAAGRAGRLPPGQRLTAAAVLTEAAEAKTCDAEACTICADWPGLCYTCQILSGQASSLRELAAELSREVTTWASTSRCPAPRGGCRTAGGGQASAPLAAPLDGRWWPRVEHRGGPVSAYRPDRHRYQ